MSDQVGGVRDEAAPGGAIGSRLAVWRGRRGLGPGELGELSGVSASRIGRWERGEDWVDRRGQLAALAGVLGVGVGELTGQPYPPVGDAHIAVRAAAFQLRRQFAEARTPPPPGTGPGHPMRMASDAEAAGDEQVLAGVLPGLIATAEGGSRALADALAAGLLRRLGYGDLAWLYLHRARAGGGAERVVLLEEIRLLTDLGLPEHAVARAERGMGTIGDPESRGRGSPRPPAAPARAAAGTHAGPPPPPPAPPRRARPRP
ncbi:helix-turn-helix domain-containing protein, partial [Streptomyces sp. NPDC058953]|uniref:helix-turn-helix domain-containing protein n=1 Tax=Streptomyces sp. NPDC058953 TaxID=3346676 RepID=UPI003681B8C6